MSKALRAAFHRLVHRLRPRPVGSRLMIARYRHLRAACSVGKWPRAFTARRSRALIDSIALAVQMTVLNFPVEGQERHEFGPGVLPQLDYRRVAGFPLLAELGEPVERPGLGRGGADGLEVFGDLRPVPLRCVFERIAQKVNDTCLDDGLFPDGAHRAWQALEPVADQHADVLDAPVLDLREDPQPVLG